VEVRLVADRIVSPVSDHLQIISDKRLAELLGVSTVTLWRMRASLPPKIQISPGRNGRRLSDVSAWLEQRAAR
jgi:predicted DNA-binding transcriptional regulator AlpA